MAANMAAQGMYSLVSAADTRRCDLFGGSGNSWLPWSFAACTALQELEWGDLLVADQNATQPVSDTHGAELRQVSRNACSLRSQKTRGKAQTLVRLIGPSDANGLEAWRQLWQEFQPHGQEPEHASLSAVIQPKCRGAQGEALHGSPAGLGRPDRNIPRLRQRRRLGQVRYRVLFCLGGGTAPCGGDVMSS